MTIWDRIGTLVRDRLSAWRIQGEAHRARRREVEQAIERVVDHSNPRIRALSGYRRKLYDPVSRCLDYCAELVGRMPGPVVLDRETWASDPLVNSLFGSVDSLRRAITGPQVRRYLRETALGTGDCCAVMLLVPLVRTQLGMDLRGDTVQRDVKQTTVSFTDPETVLPAADPDAVRHQAAETLMDTLVGVVVKDIAEQEGRIAELEDRIRIVKIKQKALAPHGHAMNILGEDLGPRMAEVDALAKRVEELEKELAEARVGLATLDDYLERLSALLAHPEVHVDARLERVRLDRMNVVRYVGDDDPEDGIELEFLRAYRDGKPGRVVLLVRFPRAEVIPDSELVAEAERYVNA
jgi:polyhydroxyalkanoate synthesis regulator phasin